MKDAQISLHDPIAALATPPGTSAIAVIRTSGGDCISKFAPLFDSAKPIAAHQAFSCIHGFIHDPRTKEKIDEVIISVFRAPQSYTGEDSIEISCHGSIACIAKILETLRKSGFRDAGPGEFTLRAFSNGKMDLTQAEAVNEIIHAESDRARILALHRLSGKLSNVINEIKLKLVDVLSKIEVMIDYPDEEYEHQDLSLDILNDTASRLTAIAQTYAIGRTIQQGAVMAIAGRTNAGKSTLFNLLVREERSIVSEYHGTTRDFIEEKITVAGIPIRLYDTAGFRAGEISDIHPVESEGIRRSENLVSVADVILYLIDASNGITPEDTAFLEKYRNDNRVIAIWNKADIQKCDPPANLIALSCETQIGLQNLEKAITERLTGGITDASETVMIDSQRQKEAIDRALEAINQAIQQINQNASYDLIAFDLRDAVNALGMLTGEVTSTDILNTMFDKFCVGK